MRAVSGSSPRGRGKPASDRGHGTPDGLIPAWAGKTTGRPTGQIRPPAHPRVGGENSRIGMRPAFQRGSSPRGRGKPTCLPPNYSPAGLIPAWAGKTRSRLCWTPSSRAHPRVGGENSQSSSEIRRRVGSSPRGRGKLQHGRVGHDGGGLIPAWAGKTAGAA